MSALEQNKAIVRRVFNEFWLAGNTGVLDELLAQDVINHELSKDPVAGRTAYKGWATGFRQVNATGLPDLDITLDAHGALCLARIRRALERAAAQSAA
jgi:hypothetical protein